LSLSNLHDLTVAGNQICEIPIEIRKMKALKYAVFTHNRLTLRLKGDSGAAVDDAAQIGMEVAAPIDAAVAAAAGAAKEQPNPEVHPGQKPRGTSDANSIIEEVPFYARFVDDTSGVIYCVEGNPDIDRLFVQPPEFSVQQSLAELAGPVPSSVTIGWSEMCGRRSDMQDALCIVPSFQGMPRALLAGVYDGHSGCVTSRFVSKRLHTVLSSSLYHKTPDVALHETYKILYHELKYREVDDGATAITTLLLGNKLYVANAGDSRAVLCRKGRAVDLSIDQKPTSPKELKRILEAGGIVSSNGRVNGELAVPRSLGDIALHPFVTWEPDVMSYTLTPDDEFIIIACDGVWDVLNSQQAVNIVRQVADPGRGACTLRDFAYLLDSGDNLSAVVIRLSWGSYKS